MDAFLAWLEHSALGQLMRGSGVWTYGVVNLAHILSVSALFGAVLVLDLRLAGCWRQFPVAALAAPATRIAKTGFGLAVLTGVCLLATKATEYAGNPFFWWVKLPAIFLAVANAVVLEASAAWKQQEDHPRLQRQGVLSLVLWLTAMVGGRMTAYW